MIRDVFRHMYTFLENDVENLKTLVQITLVTCSRLIHYTLIPTKNLCDQQKNSRVNTLKFCIFHYCFGYVFV